jgi:polysaccharide export outer membrane protein
MVHEKRRIALFALLLTLVVSTALAGQEQSTQVSNDYVIGAQDVLTVTCYDQSDLSGKFTVEADGTFTYPFIGRVKAAGLTLRALEQQLKKQLVDEGFFKNPQVTVAVDAYRSQKVFIVGEVRQPGSYTLSGDMSLIEALARAGSTLPSASGEAVIVHANGAATGPILPTEGNEKDVEHVDLRELQNGLLTHNPMLRDGDTIFIPQAQSIYVYGQVRNPGAYTLQHKNSTVLQALALAGGVTDRGRTSGLKIRRTVEGKEQEIRVKTTDLVKPGDVIMVPERFF